MPERESKEFLYTKSVPKSRLETPEIEGANFVEGNKAKKTYPLLQLHLGSIISNKTEFLIKLPITLFPKEVMVNIYGTHLGFFEYHNKKFPDIKLGDAFAEACSEAAVALTDEIKSKTPPDTVWMSQISLEINNSEARIEKAVEDEKLSRLASKLLGLSVISDKALIVLAKEVVTNTDFELETGKLFNPLRLNKINERLAGNKLKEGELLGLNDLRNLIQSFEQNEIENSDSLRLAQFLVDISPFMHHDLTRLMFLAENELADIPQFLHNYTAIASARPDLFGLVPVDKSSEVHAAIENFHQLTQANGKGNYYGRRPLLDPSTLTDNEITVMEDLVDKIMQGKIQWITVEIKTNTMEKIKRNGRVIPLKFKDEIPNVHLNDVAHTHLGLGEALVMAWIHGKLAKEDPAITQFLGDVKTLYTQEGDRVKREKIVRIAQFVKNNLLENGRPILARAHLPILSWVTPGLPVEGVPINGNGLYVRNESQSSMEQKDGTSTLTSDFILPELEGLKVQDIPKDQLYSRIAKHSLKLARRILEDIEKHEKDNSR